MHEVLNKWLNEQDLELGLTLKWPRIPTFPSGNSTLDIIILDDRINLRNFKDNFQVTSIPYDSDHNAIFAVIKRFKDTLLRLQDNDTQHKLNYKKTNWIKFKDYLSKNQKIKIPTDRNLNIEELDNFINILEANIKQAIEITVPKNKTINATDKYINGKIKRLKKDKNYLLSLIHRERYCKFNPNCPQLYI